MPPRQMSPPVLACDSMFSTESDIQDILSRRAFLGRSSHGIGALALTSLLNPMLLQAHAGAAQEK